VIKRLQLFILAAAALATAVGIALVAAAFAVYAVMRPVVGEAGAAAVVAAVAAVVVGVAALLMRMEAGGSQHRREPEPSLADRVFQVARERPLVAGGAALAAGLLALKNPQAAAGLVSAFLAGRATDHHTDRRRR
jgi:hypothetical protein